MNESKDYRFYNQCGSVDVESRRSTCNREAQVRTRTALLRCLVLGKGYLHTFSLPHSGVIEYPTIGRGGFCQYARASAPVKWLHLCILHMDLRRYLVGKACRGTLVKHFEHIVDLSLYKSANFFKNNPCSLIYV